MRFFEVSEETFKRLPESSLESEVERWFRRNHIDPIATRTTDNDGKVVEGEFAPSEVLNDYFQGVVAQAILDRVSEKLERESELWLQHGPGDVL